MQSLLDDSAPLVLESLPTAKLELGATLVQGREEYYAARTSAEELRRSNLCLYRARHERRTHK